MASVLQRGSKWRVRVIRTGHPVLTKTFITRRDADQWARFTELDLERGLYICPAEAQRTTLEDALDARLLAASCAPKPISMHGPLRYARP